MDNPKFKVGQKVYMVHELLVRLGDIAISGYDFLTNLEREIYSVTTTKDGRISYILDVNDTTYGAKSLIPVDETGDYLRQKISDLTAKVEAHFSKKETK